VERILDTGELAQRLPVIVSELESLRCFDDAGGKNVCNLVVHNPAGLTCLDQVEHLRVGQEGFHRGIFSNCIDVRKNARLNTDRTTREQSASCMRSLAWATAGSIKIGHRFSPNRLRASTGHAATSRSLPTYLRKRVGISSRNRCTCSRHTPLTPNARHALPAGVNTLGGSHTD
jgi:hypothetical protein